MVSFRDFLKGKRSEEEGTQNSAGKDTTNSAANSESVVSESSRAAADTVTLNAPKTASSRIKEIGFNSNLGMRRSVDEDSIVTMQMISAFEARNRKLTFLILADGMGGHKKGELASKIASLTVCSELQKMLNPIADGQSSGGDMDFQSTLQKAVMAANNKILSYAQEHPDSEGMGTTLVAALMDDIGQLYIANVGDSRLYVVNKEKGIMLQTKDHSYVQELVDKGEITAEEARHHPRKNVINRAVGIYAEVKTDTSMIKLDENDVVLLCSDGLINHLTDDEMANIVQKNTDSQVACDELVALANQRGGTDNISVIIAPAGIALLR